MKKWFDEEYEFTVEVIGFLRGDHTERYCRDGEEIGDTYTCTYGCPVNKDGYGICSKTMMMLYPLMEAVRGGGDLENLGGDSKYTKTVVCPDGCVMFRLTAKPLGNENFHKGGYWKDPEGANRPGDGAGCPVDIRSARTETECRCSAPTEVERRE